LKINHPPAQDEDFGQNCLEIQRIYTLSTSYGQGLGEALLEKAIDIARSHSYDFVWLGVWEHNPRASDFTKNMVSRFSATTRSCLAATYKPMI
jgi:diamine N-acetyltransferase